MEMDDPFGDDPYNFSIDAVASVSTRSVQVLNAVCSYCMIHVLFIYHPITLL